SAADTNTQHARRAPAGAHFRYLFQYPIHHRVRRVQHGELGFGFRTAALGCYVHVDGVTRHQLHVDDGRGVVFGVVTLAVRIGQHRRTQHVIRVGVSAAYAFVTHIFHAHVAFELHVHTDGEEHGDDTGILTDRTVAHGAHTGVDQNLCHGVFGSLGFFTLVGFV